jgi:hypothetical protein
MMIFGWERWHGRTAPIKACWPLVGGIETTRARLDPNSVVNLTAEEAAMPLDDLAARYPFKEQANDLQ